MTVREILGSDLEILQDAGLSRDEIISIAKLRKASVLDQKKIEAEKNYDPYKDNPQFNPLNPDGTPRKINKQDPNYQAWRAKEEEHIKETSHPKDQNIWEGQSFLDRAMRGAVTTVSELDLIQDSLKRRSPRKPYVPDPVNVKIVEDAREKDKKFNDSLKTEEQKAHTEAIGREYEQADGVWDTTKAGAKLLYDKAVNDRWNIGGMVGEMVNPINAVGLGSGKVVSKMATSTLTKKALAGATVGAVGQGALNAGYEYTTEKALGKSDKEAKKAALIGGLTGGSMGAVLGGVAGAKVKAKLQAKHKEAYTHDFDELLNNELMQLDEVESHAKQAQPIIEEVAKMAQTPDEINQAVLNYAPPTDKEIATTFLINDNQPVSPRFAGNRVRNALVKSIENPTRHPQEMFAVLKDEGFTDEAANAITVAYQNKDVTLFDDFMADKMSEVIDTHIIEKKKQLEYKNERTTGTQQTGNGDEPRATDWANESSTPVRTDAEPNAEQASLSRVKTRDGEASPELRQHSSQDGETVGLSPRDEGVDGHQAVEPDGAGVPRVAKNEMVQNETRLDNDVVPKRNSQADAILKASEIPVGGSEDEAKARVKALFRKKEKPRVYDKEELQHYAEQYFNDTFSPKELDNAIAHLPKKEAKKLIAAKNGKIDEDAIEVLENLRREGFPHMDEEIARYEELTDKYFEGDTPPTKKEEAEIEALEVELKDYFDKEEYIDARTQRKELETLSDATGNKSSSSQGDEPSRGSSQGESEPPTKIAPPKTKGERKALNAKVEEIIKKPIEDTTAEDRAILEHYTGKGGLERGTKESLTQHYTVPETIDAMYRALDEAGIPIKTALEPAVGSGNFLKGRKNTKFTTVDTDKTNHEVVKRLFPDAEHHHKGYEEFKGSEPFDLVISNVPFSEERGAGRVKHRPDVKALHDHFFIKALEDVKDNGVVAFITSKGVMDKANSKIRKEITSQADVIGAYRLPNSTFKHTHTDVVSDVIFLQKRPKGAKSRMKFANEAFETSSKGDDGVLLSDYYRKYGDNVLGDMKLGIDPMYGNPTYLVTGDADYSKMKVNYKPYEMESQNKSVSPSKGTPTPQKAVKSKAKGNKKSKNELKTELLEQIEKNKSVEDVELYKERFGKHPLDDRGLKSYHKEDIDRLYELGAMFDKEFNPAESFYSKTQHRGSGRVEVSEKSPLLERLRFNENAEGIFDATNATHIRENLDEIFKHGYAYIGDGRVQNEVLYYSGNIYKKLDQARAITDMDVSAQIKKLEKSLPKRKSITEMNFKGNEPWLLDNDIKLYRLEQVKKTTRFKDGSTRTDKVWKSEFGKVFDNYLNNRKLVNQEMGESEIAYRRKLRAAEGEVKDTLAEIKQRAMKHQEEIEEVYNRKFNFYKAPDYAKLDYMIEDMLSELPDWFTPRETQKKFVIKALYEGKNINAHDVGGGKTFAGIMLGRVLKQKGIAKKPLYVVPSKVIKNWEKEILELFPDAKIINLGNLDKTTRTKKLFELSNQNADFVLISQEGFKALKLPKEKEIEYTNALMRENLQNSELKGRQKAIQDEKIAMYMEVMSQANNDKRITIDKLGIDAIIADEARAFKNIGVRSSLASKGLGKPFGLNATKKGISLQSALAYDFRFKTKYISEMNNNRNIYMLDATPTPNKPLELFTMLKHLDDKIFDEYNIRTDEDFVNQFLETGQVQDKNGKFKDSITGIKNVFELRSIMDRFIDRISMQEFKDKGYIDIPESKTYKHILEASDESDMVFSEISERLAEAKSDISKRKDVLGIFSNGVSASVDPRLYKQMHISELAYRTKENNKIDAVVSKVIETKTKDKKAGQIIFVDSAGQNAEHLKYNLHQELKQKLIKEGKYKKEQIAILSGQEITVNGVEKKLSGNKMAEQKQQIVNDYNAGKIKVVIGTTKSAGEGMNIQKFTKDIYHLDLPWTPAEITQRNGRGVRYGNKYKSVNIHYFFTQGSFDDLMFNTVTKKQGWNDLIWDAKAQSHLKIADSDGGGLPSADEIFLSMEKDPIKRKELELGMQHQKLEDELFNVEDEVRYAESKLGYAKSRVSEIKGSIKKLEREIEHEVVDTQSLKELQAKAIKNDKKFGKKFDDALKQRLETKKRWVKQNEDKLIKKLKIVERAKEALDVAKEDVNVVQKRLDDFEEVNVGDDGKYLSGVEGC